MGWKTVAYGTNLDQFESSLNMQEVPHGTQMILEIDTYPYPVAPLANLWGMEWVASRMMGAGARIDDVEGDGWYKVKIHMTAQSVLLWVILAIVGIIGLGFLVHEIRLLVFSAEANGIVPDWQSAIKWGAIGLAALVVIMAVGRR